jgi:hypothetical protein
VRRPCLLMAGTLSFHIKTVYCMGLLFCRDRPRHRTVGLRCPVPQVNRKAHREFSTTCIALLLCRVSDTELLTAVREAVAGEYKLLGELGCGERGTVFYLAHELTANQLVALKVEPLSGGDTSGEYSGEYSVDVLRELDASVPDVGTHCPQCAARLREWARFCTQCGLDVSGVGPSLKQEFSRAELLDAVRAAAAGEYEVFGEMPRRGGGGLVYFARELASGKIVGMKLQEESEDDYLLGVTHIFPALAQPKIQPPDGPLTVVESASGSEGKREN